MSTSILEQLSRSERSASSNSSSKSLSARKSIKKTFSSESVGVGWDDMQKSTFFKKNKLQLGSRDAQQQHKELFIKAAHTERKKTI